ncbi:MAG: hypothetical protein ACTSPY_16660 [Candidatus Helarchaeota archaeon]
MSYEKIKAILRIAKESPQSYELMEKIGEDPAFLYGKNKEKVLIRRQRKQYINKCIKLGLLDENFELTELGLKALDNFDQTIAELILKTKYDKFTFKELLLQVLADIRIPTVEEIRDKLKELGVKMSVQELRSKLNTLAKCGILQKNKKYVYTFKSLDLESFENILRSEYNSAKKDPTGLIWFEEFKENIIKNYNITPNQFDTLFNKLKSKKPRLIGIQRSRTKTWILLREGV